MDNDYVRLIPQIYADNCEEAAAYYDNCGADELFYYDEDSFKEGGEENVKLIKKIYQATDVPLNVFAKVSRFEDIKKMIYAGARRVFVLTEGSENLHAAVEASRRFGSERVYIVIKPREPEQTMQLAEQAVEEQEFGGIVLSGDFRKPPYMRTADYLAVNMESPVYIMADVADKDEVVKIAKTSVIDGIIFATDQLLDVMDIKQELTRNKVPVNIYESALPFEEFKKNSEGLVPCITQDYRTGEVLMLAYMNKEAFESTIASGKMTYYSRSRKQLWTKGETSGHYQYLKSLSVDCDRDTILAKVAQVGAACHTGNRSCFYTSLVDKGHNSHNPLEVFDTVFETILDRKAHPKEGSYTNYLFDKGLDKILKKCGEEATEIVIAAKNPDSDELQYEMCDFLYHMMVLMAEKDITWKEIAAELSERH